MSELLTMLSEDANAIADTLARSAQSLRCIDKTSGLEDQIRTLREVLARLKQDTPAAIAALEATLSTAQQLLQRRQK